MEQARQQIERGESAEGKQDDALDRLDEAQSEVETLRRQMEDELQRDRQARALDALRGFLSRQQSLTAETERLFGSAQTEKLWTRSLQKSLIDMTEAERALGGELVRFAESTYADAKVAAYLLREAAESMQRIPGVVEGIRQGPFDLDSWDEDRAVLRVPQEFAARRLGQLIESIREEAREQAAAGGSSRSGSSGGDRPSHEGLSPVVQLKLLRSLQAELNERTAEFAKEHPDSAKWTDAVRGRLADMQAAQAHLAMLMESIGAAVPEGGAPKGEKK
jgi:hypothetical protein